MGRNNKHLHQIELNCPSDLNDLRPGQYRRAGPKMLQKMKQQSIVDRLREKLAKKSINNI